MACADPRPRTPRIDRPGDKQAVYGDPTLLPTREGERVRMEVALAREIEQVNVGAVEEAQSHRRAAETP